MKSCKPQSKVIAVVQSSCPSFAHAITCGRAGISASYIRTFPVDALTVGAHEWKDLGASAAQEKGIWISISMTYLFSRSHQPAVQCGVTQFTALGLRCMYCHFFCWMSGIDKIRFLPLSFVWFFLRNSAEYNWNQFCIQVSWAWIPSHFIDVWSWVS